MHTCSSDYCSCQAQWQHTSDEHSAWAVWGPEQSEGVKGVLIVPDPGPAELTTWGVRGRFLGAHLLFLSDTPCL